MALLFATGFDNEQTGARVPWGFFGNNVTVTATGRFGAGNYAAANSDNSYSTCVSFPAAGTVVIGMAVRYAAAQETANNNIALYGDSNVTNHLSIVPAANGALIVKRGNGSGTAIITTATGLWVANTWGFLEIKASIHDSTGSVELKWDGTVVGTFSGDTKNGGTNNTIDTLRINGNTVASTDFDDLYICDTSGSVNNNYLGDIRVITLLPNGNGNSSQGTGSDGNSTDNYALVDEVTVSGSDYVDLDTSEKDTYGYEAIGFTPGSVKGVVVRTHMQKTDTGTITAAAVARSGSNETTGTYVSLPSGSAAYFQVFETKPGGGAWAGSDIDAAEFGVVAL